MDSLSSSLGPFILAPFETVMEGIGALDQQWKLVLIGIVLMLLLVTSFRMRPTAKSNHRALRREYRLLVKQGVATWQLPFRLLQERDGWELLPDDFLMELAARLVERDRVIDFILMVEEDDFDREGMARLTYYEPDMAMRQLAVLLTDHAGDLSGQKAIAVLEQALQIDPENHLTVIDLATQHYAAKRYDQALPLLEQAMTLSQHSLPQLRAAVGRKRPGEETASAHSLHGVLKLLGEMYEDCVAQLGPKAA